MRQIARAFSVLALVRRRKHAERLLIENLDARQRGDYESRGYFYVVGGTTGKRYRIRHGKTLNVEEVGPNGELLSALCFLPKSYVPAADVMLAQKLALELFEPSTLAVAFRCWPSKLFLP
jgi:hypothetical protein